jgi:hypothetical protein
MNNGDDTAYYLWRGFRVLAIEANPDLVPKAATRFAREIRTARLTILNVGIAGEESVRSFWICEADSRLQFNRIRTRDGWLFPYGSSGPFGDDLLGRWLSYDELGETYSEFLRLRQKSPRSLLWAPKGLLSNPFSVDLHARRE